MELAAVLAKDTTVARFGPIEKSLRVSRAANLWDYEATSRHFSWDRLRAELFDRNDDKINMAMLAIDRHAITRGIPMRSLMAELYGKLDGRCRGRGGSMHIFDVSRRFYGGNAIVGGSLPLGVGPALGERLRGSNAIVVCFFGEGAVATASFTNP